MNYSDIEKEFNEKEFDYHKFVDYALNDESIRDKLVANIVDGNNHINIYYHSYYIINEASKEKPELFYKYWDDYLKIAKHKNSYHRIISHWLLTNLISIDYKNTFDDIKDDFFLAIKDERVSNGLAAVTDIIEVAKHRPDLENEIINLFLNEDLLINYTEKHRARFYFLYMEYFEIILKDNYDQKLINFIEGCLESNTINTKRCAIKLLKKYDRK